MKPARWAAYGAGVVKVRHSVDIKKLGAGDPTREKLRLGVATSAGKYQEASTTLTSELSSCEASSAGDMNVFESGILSARAKEQGERS